MKHIVQISDTHFGTEQAPVEHALIEALQRHPPDTVLLTGDVTQRAKRHQFEQARRFLAKLPTSDCIAVPGNHDIPLYHIWQRIFAPYRSFLRTFDEVEVTRVTEECTLIALNSTTPVRHKDGILSERKIERVARELENNRHSRLRVVAAHHPTAVVLPTDRENLVQNAERAVKRWSEAGMDLILGGHIHYPFMAPLRGYYPEVDTDAWVVQAGTAVSHRIRNQKPNSFNRILIGDTRENTRIEQWNYEPGSGQFELTEFFAPWEP